MYCLLTIFERISALIVRTFILALEAVPSNGAITLQIVFALFFVFKKALCEEDYTTAFFFSKRPELYTVPNWYVGSAAYT